MTKLHDYLKEITNAQNNSSGWTAANSLSMTQLREYLSRLPEQASHAIFYDETGKEINIPVRVDGRWMSLEDAVKVDPSFKTIKAPKAAELKQLTTEKKTNESFPPIQKSSPTDPVISNDIPAKIIKTEEELKNSTPPNVPTDILSEPVTVEMLSSAVDIPQNGKKEHFDILDSPILSPGEKAELTKPEIDFDLQSFKNFLDGQGSDEDELMSSGNESDSENENVSINPNPNLSFFEARPLKSSIAEVKKEKILITEQDFLDYLKSPKGLEELTDILQRHNKDAIQFNVPVEVLIDHAKTVGKKTIEELLSAKYGVNEGNKVVTNTSSNSIQAALPTRSQMARINDYLDKQYKEGGKDGIVLNMHFITESDTLLYRIYSSFRDGKSLNLLTMPPLAGEKLFYDENKNILMGLRLSEDVGLGQAPSEGDVFILLYEGAHSLSKFEHKCAYLNSHNIPFIVVATSLLPIDEKNIKNSGAILFMECDNPQEGTFLRRLFQQTAIISCMDKDKLARYRLAYWAYLSHGVYEQFILSDTVGMASIESQGLLELLYKYIQNYRSNVGERIRNSVASLPAFHFFAPSTAKKVEPKMEENKLGGALKLMLKLLLDMQNIAEDEVYIRDFRFSEIVRRASKDPFTFAEVEALLEGELGGIVEDYPPVFHMLQAKRDQLQYEADALARQQQALRSAFSRMSKKG